MVGNQTVWSVIADQTVWYNGVMPRDGTVNRERILDAAERLVIDGGYSGTSVDEVVSAAGTSKGAFFHHFDSKADLAAALIARYAAADLAQLHRALDAVAGIADAGERLVAFLRWFEDDGDALMAEQSGCLYVAALTERQLLGAAPTAPIRVAVEQWRAAVTDLVLTARAAGRLTVQVDAEALADHLFVTFEGAFILCRSTADPGHMRRQLAVLRTLVQALLTTPGG